MAPPKRSSTTNLTMRVHEAPNPVSRKDDLVALMVSAGLHATALVLLALWVLPTVTRGNRVIRVSPGDSESIALDTIDDISVADAPPVEIVAAVEARADIFQTEALQTPTFEFISSSESNEVDSTSFTVSAAGPALSKSSPTISGAVDRVLADIQQRLSRDDLLVVWLLDASHSLVDDRKRVAERLQPFYAELIDGRGDSGHQLHSAVVSYGSSIRQRVPPTQFGQRIVDAVEDLPVDRSGNERVFDAVAKCATNYRSKGRQPSF